MSQDEITGFRPGSKSWKLFMAKLYGIGAAVVIVGALFKIQHWPFAGPLLVLGLSTEAVIFFFSAFEPIHEDIDWTLVYPELAVPDDDDEFVGEDHEAIEGESDEMILDDRPITEQLDNMLEEAKIGPELIESLGSGLKGLSDNASKLSDISNATAATDEFVQNVRGASKSASELSDAYSKTAETVSSSASELSQAYSQTAETLKNELSISSEDGASYRDEVQNVTKNLSALNSMYEMQLQGANNQVEATNKLQESINDLLENLNASIEDTRKYKDSMSQLSSNLNALNTVYGNMLTAMNVNVGVGNPSQTQPGV
ncbi:MAG: gliding motility protein GldL [Flavobacteriales bacterium]|nr:gliding motility protein GldL [Bacteroidales bacterium AH-315-I05]PCJ85845.1 MAG: gliding motility protein GldL [Flavobacteriales bacterium]